MLTTTLVVDLWELSTLPRKDVAPFDFSDQLLTLSLLVAPSPSCCTPTARGERIMHRLPRLS